MRAFPKRKHLVTAMIAVAVGTMAVHSASATVLAPIQSNIADYEAIVTASTGVTAISNGTQGDVRVGVRTSGGSGTNSSPVFGFALPALGVGESIGQATLTFTAKDETNRVPQAGANIDIYGLGVDPGTDTGDGLGVKLTQSGSRFYMGANDATAGVVKLQDNFIASTDIPTYDPGDGVITAAFTSVDISSYLNGLYAGGATPGEYVVIRLSQDVLPTVQGTTVDRFRIISSGGDAGTVNASPNTIASGAPYLSITTAVPEPASLAVFGLAGVGLIGRRRRA